MRIRRLLVEHLLPARMGIRPPRLPRLVSLRSLSRLQLTRSPLLIPQLPRMRSPRLDHRLHLGRRLARKAPLIRRLPRMPSLRLVSSLQLELKLHPVPRVRRMRRPQRTRSLRLVLRKPLPRPRNVLVSSEVDCEALRQSSKYKSLLILQWVRGHWWARTIFVRAFSLRLSQVSHFHQRDWNV